MDKQLQFLIYSTPEENAKIGVVVRDDTVWVTQKAMAELFDVNVPAVSKHLKNIFEAGELDEKVVVSKMEITTQHGAIAAKTQQHEVKFYNLDVIISVGYRVNSIKATRFRQRATSVLKEYMQKGFALDDDRLKQGRTLFGADYFRELLERIRDIRASEKVFYRQLLEIYATSIDYNPSAEISAEFFKKVQNKIHYAVSGETAAEVIFNRADAEKEFMGLLSFAGNHPTLNEAKIAKNYLNEKELRAMGQLVSGYLDFAERQAEREIPMTMADWAAHLDKILTSGGEKLLEGAGNVSHLQAMQKAEEEYKKYKNRVISNAELDYINSLKQLENKVKQKGNGA